MDGETSLAALRMTGRTPLQLSHGKPSFQMPASSQISLTYQTLYSTISKELKRFNEIEKYNASPELLVETFQ
jgi:hypothetical protein